MFKGGAHYLILFSKVISGYPISDIWCIFSPTLIESNTLKPKQNGQHCAYRSYLISVNCTMTYVVFKEILYVIPQEVSHSTSFYHIVFKWLSLSMRAYTDGLMQERHNPIANSLELRLSCTNPSISCICLLWFVSMVQLTYMRCKWISLTYGTISDQVHLSYEQQHPVLFIATAMNSCLLIYRDVWIINTLRPRQMAAIFQMTFSNVFSRMKINELRLRFHWSLFPSVQLTIFKHWFR